MKRMIVGFSLLALMSALTVARVSAGPAGSLQTECASSPPAPWASVDSPAPGVGEAKRHYLADALPGIGSRVTDTWLSDDGGRTVLNVGVKLPTEADAAALQAALGRHPDMTLPVRVVPQAYSGDELDSFQEKIHAYARSQEIPISSSVRPDISRIEVTVQPKYLALALPALLSLVPPCVLDTTAGDPIVYSNYSRTDMPPSKGGKYEEVREAGVTYFCTTGFIYELNGSGQQPIRVSTAGHCTQGVQTIYDYLDDDVGSSVSPNLLRKVGEPAPADGVFWDPEGPRSDNENYVIKDTNNQVRVDAGYTPGDVSLGDEVCRTGYTSGTDCGNLLQKNFDYTLHYLDFTNGNELQKDVDNGLVAEPNSADGDSGGPIWVALVGPPARCAALGITSGSQSDGDVVFTATSTIGTQLGGHIWTGD